VIEKVEGKQIGDEIDIILPTGAMGNIAGGEIARRMGLPIRKYCLAVNANDITHRVMQTGQFHKSDAMIKTLSDAINIQLVSLHQLLPILRSAC
jgi:threonine synthase